MSPRQINITLGTAGHIDHGKTLLTKMLTGCETDRLKEEKERGMSIELGFAPCTIADLEVGIVDVPGHESFIKTMVAGASGMDGVIFLVAADDGVMPQTREHLDILTLLGLRHGVVALTKIDRVDAARREGVREQVRHLLAGTFLAQAPILAISNVTGEGYSEFLEALSALVKSITPKSTEGVFRLPVERAFSVKGYGTVVAGIPVAGSIGLGDEVVILPQGWTGRLAGLEVYGKKSDRALAGQCAALQFRHWDHAAIERGHVLAAPGYFAPAEWYVCKLRLLAGEEFTLKNAAQLKFHTGTSEVLASAYLMEGDRAAAGEERLIQVKLAAPLVAGPGDFFIVRTPSPVRTVGGGQIIEATGRRLRRNLPGTLDDLRRRAEVIKDAAAFVEYCVRHADGFLAAEATVAARTTVQKSLVRKILDELVGRSRIVRLGPGLYIHSETVGELQKRAAEILAAFHQSQPASPGMTAEEFAVALRVDVERAKLLVALLKSRAAIVERVGKLAAPEHRETLPEKDQKLAEAVEAAFREKPFAPPSVEEAASAAKVTPGDAARAVKMLVEQGRLVEVDKVQGLIFHGEAVVRARQLLEEHIRQKGELQSVDFKYVLDTTRKFAIPLLDYFDRIGVTRRQGYTRYLRK